MTLQGLDYQAHLIHVIKGVILKPFFVTSDRPENKNQKTN
jgi:hypothetical protein